MLHCIIPDNTKFKNTPGKLWNQRKVDRPETGSTEYQITYPAFVMVMLIPKIICSTYNLGSHKEMFFILHLCGLTCLSLVLNISSCWIPSLPLRSGKYIKKDGRRYFYSLT